MIQRILAFIIVSLLIYGGCANLSPSGADRFQPRPGDILFQDTDYSDLSEVLKTLGATGWHGTVLSHMALTVVDDEGHLAVIESLQEKTAGVRMTPLPSFLERSLDTQGRPKVIVGRLYHAYQRLIPAAVQEARQLIGKPYDPYFSLDNDAYYGSELIYEVFRMANHGRPIFPLTSVSFMNPDTQEIYPSWDNWFFQHGSPAPPELQIADPGTLSRSSKLRIVHMYGIPSLRTNQ